MIAHYQLPAPESLDMAVFHGRYFVCNKLQFFLSYFVLSCPNMENILVGTRMHQPNPWIDKT